MGVRWTKEQQAVISDRNKNLLVSAAAGSGKTAVLVERIIQRVCDIEHPVDIDRLLVVTFTRAAAAEMRERVATALGKMVEEGNANEHILRQQALIHNAQITTIDSFCLFVVRNHFDEIAIDPNFRIADTGEIQLLEADVMEDLFEKMYEDEKQQGFLELINCYSSKKSDKAVRDMVKRICRLSASAAWPKEWIENLAKPYQAQTVEEMLQSEGLRFVAEQLQQGLLDSKKSLEQLLALAKQTEGLEKYAKTLEEDLLLFETVEKLDSLDACHSFLESFHMGSIVAIRGYKGDEGIKNRIKDGRNAIKQHIEKMKENYFGISLEKQLEQLQQLRPVVEELVRLSLAYTEALQEAKAQKRIMDFSDIEHCALRIFIDETTKEQTATARLFQDYFEEIMIDEYQDSNQVQEDILQAIARCREDGSSKNVFMVGDVKQSIYQFRLARPELFMNKYRTYQAKEDANNRRIDLHQNFRSRPEVLDFINDIFYKIMHEDLGRVQYDDAAALYEGASFPKIDGMQAQVLLADKNDCVEEGLGTEPPEKLEARLVASKILELMQTQQVTDKETAEPRPLEYRDIVILLRGLKSWDTVFVQTLEAAGIPAHVETSTGYFAAYEVQIMLAMLQILDNPYQDIPMAAVLRSPMVGLTEEELAEIRCNHAELPFAQAAVKEMQMAEEGPLAQFWQQYQTLREAVRDTPIHTLIQLILQETGYGNFIATMPAGRKRSANVDMLVEKAVAFEKTSYKGLFHFVRYIEQLKKYEIDFGEAELSGEQDNVVRIMTIHKSKGLEFPVVFVSGMGRKFNQMDTMQKMILHPDFGIGIDCIQGNPKVKKPSVRKKYVAERIRLEALGEELRVLYVALTRAKEKLILTGMVNWEKMFASVETNTIAKHPIGLLQRQKAASYLDWLVPALYAYQDKYEIVHVHAQQLIFEEVTRQAKNQMAREELKQRLEAIEESSVETIRKNFEFQYPYAQEITRKHKYSVSELKQEAMLEQAEKKQEAMDSERCH